VNFSRAHWPESFEQFQFVGLALFCSVSGNLLAISSESQLLSLDSGRASSYRQHNIDTFIRTLVRRHEDLSSSTWFGVRIIDMEICRIEINSLWHLRAYVQFRWLN
jgi:hypothetical protein